MRLSPQDNSRKRGKHKRWKTQQGTQKQNQKLTEGFTK
jgi:hypothetical protein